MRIEIYRDEIKPIIEEYLIKQGYNFKNLKPEYVKYEEEQEADHLFFFSADVEIDRGL